MALTITQADGTKTPYAGPFPTLMMAVVITLAVIGAFTAVMMLFAFIPIAIYALVSGMPVLGLTMLSAFRLTTTVDGQKKILGLPQHPIISIAQAGLVAWCAFGLYPNSTLADICFAIVASMAFLAVLGRISGKFLKRHSAYAPTMNTAETSIEMNPPVAPKRDTDGLGRTFL